MAIDASEKLTMNVADVATALGLSRPTVYSLIHQNRLPAIRISDKRLVIPRAALSRFLETEASKPITEITS